MMLARKPNIIDKNQAKSSTKKAQNLSLACRINIYEMKKMASIQSDQLKIYFEMLEEDEQALLWNNTNLSDPKSLFALVLDKALQNQQISEFTHILAALALIPRSKLYLWSVLEKVTLASTCGHLADQLRKACDSGLDTRTNPMSPLQTTDPTQLSQNELLRISERLDGLSPT
ncbi:hypothetical protein RFI_12401 [Reticulomyxa filosa]|uniref:Uncharacterized protein n=1 Tax=Reticulomyxa filosa TaxID=46433 RepID=X6NHC1_RETFI|nr:hypothetical protein RFI_12401 [Reticulomyxa filosa]|eukprot:ETO24752.1 hypothetical protein RFI_12401 [Reticulomyxa filosa]